MIDTKRLAALYSMLTGLSMLGMWALLLRTGQVPELESTPFEMTFSILADCATGLMLLIGGYGLYAGKSWGPQAFLVSQGALFYSLMFAIGYYGQRGESIYLGMFAVIFALMVVFLTLSFRRRGFKSDKVSAPRARS
jgi:hypothetical protein